LTLPVDLKLICSTWLKAKLNPMKSRRYRCRATEISQVSRCPRLSTIER
jgi:hypothetical protein